MAGTAQAITNNDAVFLALLVRIEPASAYLISKTYQQSPVSNYGTSKGKIYPLIRRLKDLGLVEAATVQDDGRGTELLKCTAKGRKVLRDWTLRIQPSFLLLEDPFRTMVQSFNLLTSSERLDWVKTAREALLEKREELEAYGASVAVPFHDEVHDNAVSSINSRLQWLDRLEHSLAGSSRGAGD